MMICYGKILLLFCCAIFTLKADAFQPGIKAPLPFPPFVADVFQHTLPTPKKLDVSSTLISHLAIIALKARLSSQSQVQCQVTASSTDLLWHGRVGQVRIQGKQWESRLGLTCRAIDLRVDSCEIDLTKIVAQHKLRLLRPSRGHAKISLNAIDFGNFLIHPMLKGPANDIRFVQQGTTIDPATGTVSFLAMHQDLQWRCSLRRGSTKYSRAAVTVVPDESSDIQLDLQDQNQAGLVLSKRLSEYFSSMVFDLDGCEMKFRDMAISSKGNVVFSLDVQVRKLPSRSAAF